MYVFESQFSLLDNERPDRPHPARVRAAVAESVEQWLGGMN